MNAPQRPGWAARLATMLFSGLFMLTFGAGGLYLGVLPVLDTARQSWQVRNWVPVSAQVQDVQMETHRGSKGGSTYRVTARYAYRVGGRDFESTRIGLDTWVSADNVGDWHQHWHALLSEARAREQPVAAWVDPSEPQRAVLERQPRWGLLLFRLPFALIFTAVGVGAAVVFGRALLGRPTNPRQLSSASGAAAAHKPSRKAMTVTAPAGDSPPSWPALARGRLDDPAGTIDFVRRWPRWLAAAGLLPLVVWLLPGAPGRSGGLAGLLFAAVVGTAWAAGLLHLATLRWRWQLVDGELRVDRSSWLRSRVLRVDRAMLGSVSNELSFTSRTGNGPTVEHHRLVVSAGGRQHALTPALTGVAEARTMAAHLRQALGRVR